MSEVDLYIISEGQNCILYSLQFLKDPESEFEKFVAKFKESAEFNEDYERIAQLIRRMAAKGAEERLFRPEGKMNDHVVALPVLKSKLRLYCIRLSDKIVILGNGGVKSTQSYEEDDILRGYVVTLQKFEKLLTQGIEEGSVRISEQEISSDRIFEL